MNERKGRSRGWRWCPCRHRSRYHEPGAGLVGAETFAAVDPANNNKLKTDLSRLAARSERHRYIFFMSPRFPGSKRLPQFEQGDIQVWSIDL